MTVNQKPSEFTNEDLLETCLQLRSRVAVYGDDLDAPVVARHFALADEIAARLAKVERLQDKLERIEELLPDWDQMARMGFIGYPARARELRAALADPEAE